MLFFVDDPQAQINEAYRVLEDGGVWGLSILDSSAKSKMVPVFYSICIENGLEYKENSKLDTSFSHEILRGMFESAGFKNIKIFTHENISCANASEFIRVISRFEPAKSFLTKITDEVRQKIFNSFTNAYNDILGYDTNDVHTQEFIIMIAKK